MAIMLQHHQRMRHFSTGELFRQAMNRRSALGQAVRRYVTAGRLVPDRLVVKVMTARLTPRVLRRGFVLDGFPRTVGQARGLDRFLTQRHAPLHLAVYLSCPRSVLVARLGGRRVCPGCGAIYHLRTMPPRRRGVCDRCGTQLIVRKDDRAATIIKRLQIDQEQARPLVAYYRRQGIFHRLNGAGSGHRVFQRLVKVLNGVAVGRG